MKKTKNENKIQCIWVVSVNPFSPEYPNGFCASHLADVYLGVPFITKFVEDGYVLIDHAIGSMQLHKSSAIIKHMEKLNSH